MWQTKNWTTWSSFLPRFHMSSCVSNYSRSRSRSKSPHQNFLFESAFFIWQIWPSLGLDSTFARLWRNENFTKLQTRFCSHRFAVVFSKRTWNWSRSEAYCGMCGKRSGQNLGRRSLAKNVVVWINKSFSFLKKSLLSELTQLTVLFPPHYTCFKQYGNSPVCCLCHNAKDPLRNRTKLN